MDRRVIVIALATALAGFGDPAYFGVTAGNKLYSEGKYEEALTEYAKAKSADPKRPEADYNMGAAQFKTGRFKESASSFERAMKGGSPEIRPNAAYNRSAALYASGVSARETGEIDEAAQSLKAAVKGYKAVLKEKPSDNDARHNLEIALEKLKETEKEKRERDSQKSGKEGPQQDQEKQDKKDGAGKDEQPKREQQEPQSAAKKQEQERGEGAEEKQEMTKEEAERVFSAIESDEKDLRKQIRNQNLKERPKSGKDW